jgi:hypothetical protein
MDIQNTLRKIYELAYIHRGKILVVVAILLVLNYFSNNGLTSATGGALSLNKTFVSQDLNYGEGGFAEEMAYDSAARVATTPQIPGSAAGVVNPDLEDQIDTTQRIIKTAGLTIEVDKINQSVEAISNIANRENGFVLNSNFSEDSIGNKSANMTIRVPVEKFENTLQEIKQQAIFVAHESVNGRDVTEEFVDVQAQLINLRAEEKQFQTILQRAIKIEDVLAVTRELSRVRGQIERLEGRLRFLENQTDLSTITITLREQSDVVIPTSKWRPLNVIRQTGRNIVDAMQNFVDNSIRFIGSVIAFIPQLLLLGIAFLLIRRFIRRQR